MIVLRNLFIEGVERRPITLDVFFNKNNQRKPVVIFCHGFKGFKDWGHFNLIAETFAQANICFLKFNFSKNGVTPDHLEDFVDLEAFGHNTYTDELYDIKKVLDFILSDNNKLDPSEYDTNDITVIGHSKGGGAAILAASENASIKRLITWAAVSKFGRMFDDGQALAQWKKEGVQYVLNGRTKQYMPLYYTQYESFDSNRERLNIPVKAAALEIPWLIVHGNNDQAVPFAEAELLHGLNAKSVLLTVENGDHTFGGKHPWDLAQLPKDCQFVVDKSIAFIKES